MDPNPTDRYTDRYLDERERPPISRSTRVIGGALAALVLLCVVAAAGLALTGHARFVIGSGHVISQTRAVSHFTEVDLSGSGSVTITQTGTESLTVEAEDNIMPYVTTQVQGSRLSLGEGGLYLGLFLPRKPVHYVVTVKDLAAIAVSGSGDVHMSRLTSTTLHLDVSGSGTLNLDSLTASSVTNSISGSGEITISGQVQHQEITVSGSGSYRGSSLASSSARAEVSGSGNVTVQVSDTLDVTISGSGSVTYLGKPHVTEHISGSGSVSGG